MPLLPRRVVDLLLPGENVLQALRRLAAVRQPAGATPAVSTAGSGSGGGGSSPAAEALAQHVRALRGPAMPPAVREKFEQLVRREGWVGTEQGRFVSGRSVPRAFFRHSPPARAADASLNSDPLATLTPTPHRRSCPAC